MPQELYQIKNIVLVDGQLVSEVWVNAGHSVFEGHFPGSPVTPGVMQLQMVRDILSAYLAKPLRLKSLRTCKFLEVMNPASSPAMTITIRYKEEHEIEVTASGKGNDAIFFKMQATYA
ncbi:3-hydroxyacyl-ACP dehydratase [Dyadobacter aurulentus]|uniref:3-hydroxyacyl-ACP dehydratase n=1 Tax=Dyadobacter sp. UC 10 TaxID=2605428 RepID=UPI001CEC227C|nr:3-hydroxyacyl-ACP dehydratase [Dyadobacter sp. UC 10]